MAAKKEISGFIKLQIKGGQANPAPPVGPAPVDLEYNQVEKVS